MRERVCERAWPVNLIYELHVGTFTPAGTFDGAIERLGELARLGVSHLELMPVADTPGDRGWGYDGVDLGTPHHAYGGEAGLRRLIEAAHARGLGVLLDVVYNHVGPEGATLPAHFFTERHHTPWGRAIDFSRADVRAFYLDNARRWVQDLGFDGLRLDATHAIFDDESPRHFLAELRAALPDALLIAEHETYDPRLWRDWHLDAFWYDDFHHAIHAAFTGERHGYYEPFGRLADIARAIRAGRSDAPGDRCVACIQNHDQTGNRALGERLGHLVSPGRLRLAAALLFAAPFVPMLFQGEEWNASAPFQYFTDHQSPELARAVREGRRREHGGDGPDPQDPETMRRSTLDWSERTRPGHREILEWYEALSALRRARAELRDGRRDAVTVDVDEHARTIGVRRGGVTVIGNLGARPARLEARGDVVLAYPEPPRDGLLDADGCAVLVS